ncbi:MAG TPA: ADOP family duplicated permease [Bryobacteraceae bacterium]|nr:ADOP family duplicated permease [Bryobacteraceae bacterium]
MSAEMLARDAHSAARAFAKNPVWAAAVICSLALGIGANVGIFSLSYAILLKSLPVPDPGQLILYTFSNGKQSINLSGPAYDSLERHQSVTTGLLAWSGAELALDRSGQSERIKGALLSSNGFEVLGLKPFIGTAFHPDADVPGGGAGGYEALLGYDFWQNHLGGDRQVLGHSLAINGSPVTVIGVLPRGFDGLIAGTRVDIILPLAFDDVLHAPKPYRRHPGAMWLTVMGRLKPNESLNSAKANLRAIQSTIREEADPGHKYLSTFFAPFVFNVESGHAGRSFLKVSYERPLLVLELLVVLLLVLCCANTALLVAAQMATRARELAVRCALGASRNRLFCQVFLEILLLAVPGLLLAAGIGWFLASRLAGMLGQVGAPVYLQVTPNWVILGFAGGLTVVAALAAGLVPALRASRSDPASSLGRREEAGSTTNFGFWIVPAQVAVSVVLVASALLLGSTFLHLYSERSGFSAQRLYFADIDLGAAKLNDAKIVQTAEDLLHALASYGDMRAAILSVPPLSDSFSAGHYYSVGPTGAVHSEPQTWVEIVSPGYFPVVGTRMLEGRAFDHSDLNVSGVCVLSRGAADAFFPHATAVSRFIYSDPAHADPSKACRVIGIAEDARFRSLREAAPPTIYKLPSSDNLPRQFTLAVRTLTDNDPSQAIRNAASQASPGAPAPVIYSFSSLVDAHLRKERMLISLSACFAGAALVLTCIGLFGLLIRSVTQTTREIGIRMALGAGRGAVIGSLVRRAVVQILVGLAAGTILAFATNRTMKSLVYGIEPGSLATYIVTIIVIVAVVLLTMIVPARRATSIDPIRALRVE